MPLYALSSLLVLAAASTVMAQVDPAVTEPLANKRFAYPGGIPEKVDTDQGTIRGPQLGFNICNSTTENQQSDCQTTFLNHIDDFCLWAPARPNSTIADTEGEEVAWCTKPGHGTRLIPGGALTGVQYMKTPDYVQVVGFLDQTQINIEAGDFGGELDPHGADLRGNPLGGIFYSNAFPSNGGNNNSYQQVIEWHNFMGGNQFCLKACDPAGANAANLCQHIYDRIGCAYNAPNAAQDGVFEACEGDDQDPPGIFTSNGVVMTYTQPPESDGAISTMPYQPKVPASSNCVTYSSADIFTALPSSTAAPSSSGASSGAASSTGNPSGKGASSSGSATRSGSAAGATNTSSNGASPLSVSFVGIVGAVTAMVFLS